MRCLAAPIRDRFGHVIGGMSVSFPCFGFREELKQDYVKATDGSHAADFSSVGLAPALSRSQVPPQSA